ncbi:LacI family DNA-binding transcriptional regulator [Vibrio rumoiensis]|uniref:LacI family DNA-binding transcriptional regulator n=1 Tax=Vibrio rumoiensis TaxID=76258 RepID=A0ABW7J0C1_9VIBR
MASIKDVAKLAGVSLMTVSRAINQPDRVREKTLNKVQKAIDSLSYVPYESAQKMRSRASTSFEDKTIIVLALDVATTPFSVDILYAIEETLRKHGWHAIVINTSDITPPDEVIDKVLAQRPAGIIYTSMGLRKVNVPERLRAIPIVLANCVTDSCQCPAYIPNDRLGQYNAMREVLSRGKSKVLYLTLPQNIIATPERDKGFELAISERTEHIDVRKGQLTDPVNYNQTIDMIDDAFQNGYQFDVLVCGNDRMALVAQMYLLSKGIKIPTEVSILGFDNMLDMSDLFYPQLTTVELPHRKIGEEAALHIVMQKTHNDVVSLNCPLIIRNTLQ